MKNLTERNLRELTETELKELTELTETELKFTILALEKVVRKAIKDNCKEEEEFFTKITDKLFVKLMRKKTLPKD